MNKAHVIQLNPTNAQEIFFKKSCGVARFAYNWALNKWQNDYKDGIIHSGYTLVKHLNSIKRLEFVWMQETGKSAPQCAIMNLESAYKAMWRKGAKYPKFKKRGVKDSFVAVQEKEAFKQCNYKIHIPRLGMVKCTENLRFLGKVNRVTVKRVANKWFAVVSVETPDEIPLINESQVVIGVDLGIKMLATCSNGMVFENPKALRSNLKSLKRLQRSMTRKVKGSNNRERQQKKVAKKHYRISCIRKNALHQATTKIVNSANVIVIEDLNILGMAKNHRIAQAISDVGFYGFGVQIKYKSLWQQKQVIVADRFFASSKLCSCCGWKKDDLNLSDRTFICLNCNLVIDRDLNASLNLQKYGTDKLAETIRKEKAFGEGSSVVAIQQSLSVKDEVKYNALLKRSAINDIKNG